MSTIYTVFKAMAIFTCHVTIAHLWKVSEMNGQDKPEAGYMWFKVLLQSCFFYLCLPSYSET